MIYCAYEQQPFPEDQFRDDPVHGKVHKVTPEHTTAGDELAGGGDGDGGVLLVPDAMEEETDFDE